MSSLLERSLVLQVGDGYSEENGEGPGWEPSQPALERTAVVGMVENQKIAEVKCIIPDQGEHVKLMCGDNEGHDGGKDSCGSNDGEGGGEGCGGEEGSGGKEDRGGKEGCKDDAEDSDTSRKVMEYLHDAREDTVGDSDQPVFQGYKKIHQGSDEGQELQKETSEHASEVASENSSPPLYPSTIEDIQSSHGSVASSPVNSAYGSHLSSFAHSPPLHSFDHRFQSRLQPSPSPLPIFSCTGSGSVSTVDAQNLDSTMGGNPVPWDVIRWIKLKKIKDQVFSEAGRRNFGMPTCISISAVIVIGTSKGIILVFDYAQSLKSIIGPGTKAVECGSITALAASADHTTIAGGHSQGHIFTWELAKPTRPFLTIPPQSLPVLEARKVDGRIEGVSVLHLGFLGTRHTALVSADGKGMAFSHLATRGFGAIVRIVKTTRILGRYPFDVPISGRPRKPSSTLAFSPLPLGNAPQETDSMGLVAILTPYLLVIISTTPIAQTQHKASRPKEVASDMPLSGCLAWFPSVKLKDRALGISSQPKASTAKLAYSWSNVLTVLELTIEEPEPSEDPNKPPTLRFRAKSRWVCDEAIVGVQWISRQILGVLTVTQRLVILEEPSLRMTETFDLVPQQIVHHRHFRHHLMPLLDTLDEEASFHPAIADAFYNSFKTYKGRIFLLCQYEVSMGTLSNWADRLLAMMEAGDFIGAIRLATLYYAGEADKVTVGLPDEPHLRHPLVQEKILEMMAASLRYAFARTASAAHSEILGKDQLRELAKACFTSCLCMDTTDFLFYEVFDYYESGGCEGIFLETSETHILEGRITSVPPTIMKALIIHFTSLDQGSRLEEMICHMDTTTMDIDQVTTLCKQHNLYDALIYVWNRALGDYITPMVDLLSLLKPLANGQEFHNRDSIHEMNALKIFPYLSYTLTGRIYPTGELLQEPDAIAAKAAIYYFLFLGRPITWPRPGGTPFLVKTDSSPEQSFSYLRLILHFDAPSLLSALNEAFEDSFLNGPIDPTISDVKGEGTEEQMFSRSVNRQYIITILQEVMNSKEFPPLDTVYLNMFIARNLPKFQQFILLKGSALNSVLAGLCHYPVSDIADDCQLSVEYLLSVYHPPQIEDMVELLEEAKFHRVLKSIFRSERQYGKLFQAYFQDEESPEAVFGCIKECLQPQSQISERQREEVHRVIISNIRKLIDIDSSMTAKYINTYAADLHGALLDQIQDRPQDQFTYLRAILELPAEKGGVETKRPEIISPNPSVVELYVRLMCSYDPQNVQNFVGRLQSGDLRLEEVLPSMERSGVIDATVFLMAREGHIRESMDRLIKHLHSIEAALLGLLQAQMDTVSDRERAGIDSGAEELLASLKKYTQVGIWLCQGQMQPKAQVNKKTLRPNNDVLSSEELLWLDFIDTTVQIAKNCTLVAKPVNTLTNRIEVNGISIPSTPSVTTAAHNIANTVILPLRKLVQDAFTALLTSTATRSASHFSPNNTPFLRILRAFLSRAAVFSPSLSELRSVLTGIFDAYMYENQLLTLANKLLDNDRFTQVDDVVSRRLAGWRPFGQVCEACGRRAWGPGAAGGIFAAWEKRRLSEYKKGKEQEERENKKAMWTGVGVEEQQQQQQQQQQGGPSRLRSGKGKAPMLKSSSTIAADERQQVGGAGAGAGAGAGILENSKHPKGASELVVFTCRHVYHRVCLEKLQDHGGQRKGSVVVKEEGDVMRESGGPTVFKCVACDNTEAGV